MRAAHKPEQHGIAGQNAARISDSPFLIEKQESAQNAPQRAFTVHREFHHPERRPPPEGGTRAHSAYKKRNPAALLYFLANSEKKRY